MNKTKNSYLILTIDFGFNLIPNQLSGEVSKVKFPRVKLIQAGWFQCVDKVAQKLKEALLTYFELTERLLDQAIQMSYRIGHHDLETIFQVIGKVLPDPQATQRLSSAISDFVNKAAILNELYQGQTK